MHFVHEKTVMSSPVPEMLTVVHPATLPLVGDIEVISDVTVKVL